MKRNGLEKLLWCVALPGFGQFLNKKYVKGIVLLILEILVNVKAKLNEIIVFSFQGKIEQAIAATDIEWLMFYPCVYMFAIWDAYRDDRGETSPFSFLPFLLAGFFGTVGVIYSTKMTIAGFLLGPVWLPMLFSLIGVCVGWFLRLAGDRHTVQT